MANATEETLSGTNINDKTYNLLSVTADATSPAAAGYYTTTPQSGFARFSALTVYAEITGATGGTLNVIVETSTDGVTWYEMVSFAQAAAGAAKKKYSVAPQLDGVIYERGSGNTTTVSLPAGTAFGGQWYDYLRVRYIAGASTSAGAAQVVRVIGRQMGH